MERLIDVVVDGTETLTRLIREEIDRLQLRIADGIDRDKAITDAIIRTAQRAYHAAIADYAAQLMIDGTAEAFVHVPGGLTGPDGEDLLAAADDEQPEAPR
jgi:hypothetical protein